MAEPNTALLSAILMFGTFFIAYFLRIFRNGQGHNSTSYLGCQNLTDKQYRVTILVSKNLLLT